MQPARIVAERELPVEVAVADDTGVAEVRVNEQKAFQRGSQTEITVKETVELDEGTHEVTVTAGPEGVRFLLVSGAPIEEPVAWAGPIVMNTEAELRQAFTELRNGTFIRPAH